MSRRQQAAPRIAFVGDTHCGSLWGLWPRSWMPKNWPRNTGPDYLGRCFDRLLEDLPKRIDVLFLMGDLVDGPQRKSAGTGLFATSLGQQVKGAIEVLRPLVKRAGVVYRVEGTPYHEDFHQALGELDVALGIEKAAQVFDFDTTRGLLNVAHHPAGGSTLYRGTGADREIVWATVAEARGNVHKARWIVRAHRHEFYQFDDGKKGYIACPCFELQTPHAVKGNYFRWQPSLGAAEMIPSDDARSGYVVKEHLFPVPTPKVHRVAA